MIRSWTPIESPDFETQVSNRPKLKQSWRSFFYVIFSLIFILGGWLLTYNSLDPSLFRFQLALVSLGISIPGLLIVFIYNYYVAKEEDVLMIH